MNFRFHRGLSQQCIAGVPKDHIMGIAVHYSVPSSCQTGLYLLRGSGKAKDQENGQPGPEFDGA